MPGQPPPGEAAHSRFYRTALALQGAEPVLRSTFAAAALGELAALYIAEADLARSEADRGPDGDKLQRWAAAVDRFAEQLLLVLDDVDQGFPVRVDPQRENAVAIAVGGRLVVLSHPRPGEQQQFEQRLLHDFCTRTDCTLLTAGAAPVDPLPLYAGVVQPDWSFTDRGPVCSHDGVSVHFDSTADLPQLREACRQLFRELVGLLTEIAWQQMHGARVDWDALAISPTPGQPEHFVRLNAAGDSVLVTLPLLYANPQLLADVTPWLHERSRGARAELTLDGRRLHREVPEPR